MSPEQIEGKEADRRSDIFSLGAVLYEMVTGKRAFEGKTTASTIASILAAEPKPLAAIQPAVAARPRSHHQDLPGQGSRRAPAVRTRRQVPVAVDRASRSPIWCGHGISWLPSREPSRVVAGGPTVAGGAGRERGLVGQRASHACDHVLQQSDGVGRQ